jgi:glycosyltransferase involved in cell wall biosynthesis
VTVSSRGRLLMISPVMPLDRGNGLAMRAAFFLDAYARRFEVDLVVAPIAGTAEVSTYAKSRAARIDVLSLEGPESHYRLAASLRDPSMRADALRRYGKPALAAWTGPISDALDHLAADQNYVTIHIFRLYLAELTTPWLDRSRRDRPLLVLDCDENDALVYRRLAAMERGRGDAAAAVLADVEAEAFAGFASTWLPRFDLLLAASDRELKSLSSSATRGAVVPNVVAMPPAARHPSRREACSLLFVGNLGYAPNADAVIWFVSRIWKRFQRMMNFKARLVIVGPNPSAVIARLRSLRGVEVTGAVADVAPYYRRADIVVAPVRAGGGTRIKIIEAAAHGVPIVSTGLAAEGTTFQPEVDMLVADHEARFLRACLLLARNKSMARRLATQARARAKRDYSVTYWQARVGELVANRDSTLAGSNGG